MSVRMPERLQRQVEVQEHLTSEEICQFFVMGPQTVSGACKDCGCMVVYTVASIRTHMRVCPGKMAEQHEGDGQDHGSAS